MPAPSRRILELVSALPLRPGMRILEIGCGPGVAAREVWRSVADVYVLAIDRSEAAIAQAISNSAVELESGRLSYLRCAVEDLVLPAQSPRFDLAFGFRVGALDGRHPQAGKLAMARIKAVLKPTGRLFIDGGQPLREINLKSPI